MNWINQIWQRIVESDNQPLLDKINILQGLNDALQDEIDAKNNVIKSQNVLLSAQNSDIAMLDKEVEQLNSQKALLRIELESLKEQIKTIDDMSTTTYFKPTIKSYRWKPGKIVRLKDTLGNLSQDTEYIQKYNEWLDSLGVKHYNTFENTVYYVHKAVLDFVDGKYKRDIKAHGTKEYWFSPQEAFEYYVTENLYDDCDGVRSLAWGAIVSRLVMDELSDDIWRLKAISISIEGSGGHAILTALKDNLVWAPLETTFAPWSWKDDWHRDCDVFKAMYGNVYNVFDEESEYVIK